MARNLPREARLQIAAELQKENDTDSSDDMDTVWRDEVVRRIRRFLDEKTVMLDGEEVYQRLKAKYAR